MSQVIDTHFHVWNLHRFEYPWPTPNEKELYRDYSIDDYKNDIANVPVKHSIFIQVLNSSPAEAKWILSIAEENPLIKGVVAGLDLTSSDLPSVLEELGKDKRFVGVRHILDFEDEKWLCRDDVHRGLALLEKHNKTFDLLLRPHLLKYVPDVIAKFPRLRFIIDHIAKPYVKDKIIDGWKEEIAEIAKYSNVYCKISGLISEADTFNWQKEDFRSYIKHILDVFGEDRCVFGSDWPVFKVSPGGTYKAVYDLTVDLLTTCGVTKEGKDKIFSQNAVEFYKLEI